jgi:hypothetical protein
VIDMNACEVFPLSALENDAAELSGVEKMYADVLRQVVAGMGPDAVTDRAVGFAVAGVFAIFLLEIADKYSPLVWAVTGDLPMAIFSYGNASKNTAAAILRYCQIARRRVSAWRAPVEAESDELDLPAFFGPREARNLHSRQLRLRARVSA